MLQATNHQIALNASFIGTSLTIALIDYIIGKVREKRSGNSGEDD